MRLGEFGLELSLMRIKATERIVTAAQLSSARLMSRKIGYSVQHVADVVMRRKPCNVSLPWRVVQLCTSTLAL